MLRCHSKHAADATPLFLKQWWNDRCGNGWYAFLIRHTSSFLCPFLPRNPDANVLLAVQNPVPPAEWKKTKTKSASRIIQHQSNVLDILGRGPAAATDQTGTRGTELQRRLAHLLARLVASPRVLAGHVRLAGVGVAEQRQRGELADFTEGFCGEARRHAVDSEREDLGFVLRDEREDFVERRAVAEVRGVFEGDS
jgi:hypothetical protein